MATDLYSIIAYTLNYKDRMGDRQPEVPLFKNENLSFHACLYFLGQISILADSNPIFTISVYVNVIEIRVDGGPTSGL